MMFVASSSETCNSSYNRYSRIPKEGEVHKVALPENGLLRKESRKSSNHIRFAPSSQVVGTVPHRQNCSEEEMRNRWFRKEEYSALIWESSITLTLLKCDKKQALVDDILLCERGLLDTEILIKRQEERSCINKLILLEMKETQDYEAVSQLYHECTITVCQRARDKAIIDEEYAKRYATGDPGAEDNYGRGQHSQADNRKEIENLILRELEKSDDLDETDQKLMKALKRLTKRKERETTGKAEQERQIEEMVLMQQLKQLADLYADPTLTPQERAAVEQAASDLLQGSSNDGAAQNNEQDVQKVSSPSDTGSDTSSIESKSHNDDDMGRNKNRRIERTEVFPRPIE